MWLIDMHPAIYFMNSLAIMEALRAWEEGQDIIDSLDDSLDVPCG
jgi:hypothetical protein